MANFVESAELRIIDSSTAQLHRISSGLRKFGADARRLQSDLNKFRGPDFAKGNSSGKMSVVTTSLRQQVAAAKSVSSALNGLRASYNRAAAGADRLTTSTQRAIRNMQTLTAEARALKSLGHIGGRLPPGAGGNGGGRGGWVPPGGGGHGGNGGFPALPPPGHNPRRPKGYKAHVYENPSHAFANLGLGATFGHDLTLGQALTISALGTITMSAAHVVLEGALKGSQAREQLYQTGGNINDKATREAISEIVNKYHGAASDATRYYSEASPFSHDPKIRQLLADRAARMVSLTRGTGESEAAVEQGVQRAFKAGDMEGLLRPDANTGEVDTAKFDKFFGTYMQMQKLEGRNLKPGDWKNMMAQGGPALSALDEKGLGRMFLYASEKGGARAGTEAAAFDQALHGQANVGAIDKLIKEGFAQINSGKINQTKGGARRSGDFAMSAANSNEANRDLMGYAGQQGIEQMRKQGLDPQNLADVKKYVGGFGLRQTASRFLQQAIERYQESERQLGAAGATRVGEDTAKTMPYRNTSENLKQIGNAAENLGNALDQTDAANKLRKVGVAIRDGLQVLANYTENPQAYKIQPPWMKHQHEKASNVFDRMRGNTGDKNSFKGMSDEVEKTNRKIAELSAQMARNPFAPLNTAISEEVAHLKRFKTFLENGISLKKARPAEEKFGQPIDLRRYTLPNGKKDYGFNYGPNGPAIGRGPAVGTPGAPGIGNGQHFGIGGGVAPQAGPRGFGIEENGFTPLAGTARELEASSRSIETSAREMIQSATNLNSAGDKLTGAGGSLERAAGAINAAADRLQAPVVTVNAPAAAKPSTGSASPAKQ